MTGYQVLARKYRPKTFREVLGQDAVVTTLKNAIKFNRIAHAYLFSGSRGTGKTTLARLFAKALNCHNLSPEFEPCNVCPSCKEIAGGHSLDVLEIDGASHRGIEDIRQINETAGYASSSGRYKIYIIDEVHMLTKEAFNALLKTLEEPPPQVKFFFATTEPHKVLPTIISRCQRFQLNRLMPETIIAKLQSIAQEIDLQVDEEAFRLIANMADGGLRDAESLFDQVLSFQDGALTLESVAAILGVMPYDVYFELDQAGKMGDLAKAFEFADRVFRQGRDLMQFIEGLIEHFRTVLLIKLAGKEASFLSLSELLRERYVASAKIYSQEQALTILDFLLEAQQTIRFASSTRIALESLLMRIIRTHQRVPIDILVKRLCDLEEKLAASGEERKPDLVVPTVTEQTPTPVVIEKAVVAPVKPTVLQKTEKVDKPSLVSQVTEDPSPSSADLGRIAPKAAPEAKRAPVVRPSRVEIDPETHRRYDTLLQFAAVELEGSVQKNYSISN